MSNTVITNYTDLNGPSTKADSSVVVIVNKDGSLSVDQNLLGTLMGTDSSQAAGISVVRVGHEGKPDDATDSENDDDKMPHVTLSVDSYYDEPNSIIKYDSGAEMLQSLKIETRENSLVGFQNDHCYTPLTSPSQSLPQRIETYAPYDEPVYEITHTPPPKPIPNSKKITILEEQIIPKGKKIVISPTETAIVLKNNDVLNKSLPILSKSKHISDVDKSTDGSPKSEETNESSSMSSGESIPDRDSDSDYKDSTDRSTSLKGKRTKLKPRILKSQPQKLSKVDSKVTSRIKTNKSIIRKEIKEKIQNKSITEKRRNDFNLPTRETKEIILPTTEIALGGNIPNSEQNKITPKPTLKPVKKEKKTPAHVTALLSDMTSLFSTPDVIRRVSTDNKTKSDKDSTGNKKLNESTKHPESNDTKILNISKVHEDIEKIPKHIITQKTYSKAKDKSLSSDKISKGYDLIPQLDDASLAQILQDTSSTTTGKVNVATPNVMNSPGMAGPLSPTLQQLDLLGGLQPEEEGLTEDILMHVAQLVESSENLQEVIDKQVLGNVDAGPAKTVQSPFQQQQAHASSILYAQTPLKSVKTLAPRKDPIEIVRRDGRVITLPPIEAPATRASKRKTQTESTNLEASVTPTTVPLESAASTPEPHVQHVSKQYVNKKLTHKKQEQVVQMPVLDKGTGESQESWNSEDDPNRLWCICKQPHNNRFMICCDGCEDWFHGKCVNVTKAMGQQMEEQGIEWRCPNCTKKAKATPNKSFSKAITSQKKQESEITASSIPTTPLSTKSAASKTNCIVCKKSARSSSIYCSDACILKHAQDSLGNQSGSSKVDSVAGKSQDKPKSESRVIVYERKSGRLLAGPNAPTAENLKSWLQKNPTFEVVRPGTLSTIKPKGTARKSLNEPNKIQTTLNFERIPRKSTGNVIPNKTHTEPSTSKMVHTKEEIKSPQPKTSVITPKSLLLETPKASTSGLKPMSVTKKLTRASKSLSTYEKRSVSPTPTKRKEPPENRPRKSNSVEPIRENVRKALQEQMSLRMAENTPDIPKFKDDEIQQFALDTEIELHDLFNRDVGMKYKAKYRSLMFNIKDRKNLSLWQKICDRTITPKQLVRLSPEDLASQELAQWRAKEEKHQLELIKKSELDLLAASKTYVLKTHKGEEVMETKEPVKADLDASLPVEDLVSALNEDQGVDNILNEGNQEGDAANKPDVKKHSKRKLDSSHKKSSRDSKRESDSRKPRSSRRSDTKDREGRSSHRSEKKSIQEKFSYRDGTKTDSKDKSDSSEHLRYRSPSRGKSRKRSKSRERSRSSSHGKDRSRSRGRSKRRSKDRDRSTDISRHRHRSRSKHRHSADEKIKNRSRSQDNAYSKNKNDSTDSDSVERPKSAMMKEIHPEYDPHEPMITSAFSEEDIRKSREDVYEDSYKNEIGDYSDIAYEPSKTFSLDTNVIPIDKLEKRDKVSEGESDQEPTSTMEHSAAIVWNGCINMVDVARFYVAAHEVSGNASDLEEDVTAELDIVGRINPDTVWEYISKMKRASNKDIVVLKLQAANDEEKMQYIALYSYLSSRNRLGVVKVSNTTTVKDFYIVPLPANTALPPVLLPFDGPGLGEVKTHLLIAIVIRQRKKRMAPHILKDIIPAKVARESRKRSYTPPAAGNSSHTPPTSPRRRAALPLPSYTSELSTSVKDKIAATLASADDEEAYSPGSSSSGSVSNIVKPENTLRTKMEELNRQIEEQKQQIRKMVQADSSVSGEDEAYSPSRPMTPPSVSAPVPLSDISLPSNLQEILATIKQRTETISSDVDMRTLP